MCGISGIIDFEHKSETDYISRIQKMNTINMYRGPDDKGFYHDENVYLGSCRLAITDPINAHQPFVCTKSGSVIVFNGEVYNHATLRKQLKKMDIIFKLILIQRCYFRDITNGDFMNF